MYLMKASGTTYNRVLTRRMHAFRGRPSEIRDDELVMLSKNVADCSPTEPQVQYVAKVSLVRQARPGELDASFPGVEAGERWEYVVELYWPRKLERPFNLTAIPGFNSRRYAQVQAFAKLDPLDELSLLNHLVMASHSFPVDGLSAEERIELIGQLWNSLDPASAAPVGGELAAELDRREAEADVSPAAGEPWSDIHRALLRKLR